VQLILTTVVVAILTGMTATPARVQAPTSKESIPRPAVAALVDSFKDHRLVAIGEMHRNEQVHAVIRAVLQDPRFLPNGGDVVVEFGSGRYQQVMDRFIAGEDVPEEQLVHVWRETVNILVWDAPVYERLFTTVRTVNRMRSAGQRLRVLLADPPIDWNNIHDRAAWEEIVATRDRHAANVIEREVLSAGHAALLIFGSSHVQNEKAFDPHGKPNLAEFLEQSHPGITLYVTADWMHRDLDARLAGWRPPALVRLKGTWLGKSHVGPSTDAPRFEDLADAFLYLGATMSLTTSVPSSEVYRDVAYLRELIRRDGIQGGANAIELQRLSDLFLQRKSRRPTQ